MRRFAFLVLLTLLALPSAAQDQGSANFTYKYDATTTTTYCALLGGNGSPWFDPILVRVSIETSGSSTDVTAVTAGTNPFANMAVGDVIYVVRDNGARDIRIITTHTDADTIVVETAVDWSDGFFFSWMNTTCGTGATDGWINVTGWDTVQMTVQYDAGDLTTLDVSCFCKEAGLGSTGVRVYPGIASDCGDGTLNGTVCELASVGDVLAVKVTHNAFAYCRIGIGGTVDGGTRDEVAATITVAR